MKLSVALSVALLSESISALQLGCMVRPPPRVLWIASARTTAVGMCTAQGPSAADEANAVEPASVLAKAKGMKMTLDQLEVGLEVEGKIKSVMSYGAFVDVGASTDGLLHVSEICNEFIKDANEKLTAGDSITCKVKAVNLEKNQLALTCKEPQAPRVPRKPKVDLSEFEGSDEKEFIAGKVNTITDFGAFVTIKEGVDGLVHISQIQEGGVGKVADVLAVGQEVQVRVTSVDKSKRRIGLSMLQWTEQTEEEKRGGRRGGGGGFGGDLGFGEADAAFQLSSEDVEALTEGDDFASPFEIALDRAASVAAAKAKKERFTQPTL